MKIGGARSSAVETGGSRGWTVDLAAPVVCDIAVASARLLRDSWRIRPTHVFSSGYAPVLHAWPALALLRLSGVPVIFRAGNAPESGAFYDRLWRRVIAPVVSRFVANSRFTERELAATGIPPRKIHRIYNAIPWRAPVTATRLPRLP